MPCMARGGLNMGANIDISAVSAAVSAVLFVGQSFVCLQKQQKAHGAKSTKEQQQQPPPPQAAVFLMTFICFDITLLQWLFFCSKISVGIIGGLKRKATRRWSGGKIEEFCGMSSPNLLLAKISIFLEFLAKNACISCCSTF